MYSSQGTSTTSSADAVGSVVSSIVNVAEALLLLPQASVAVNITVALPVAPQRSLRASKSWVIVVALQLSVAEAPARNAAKSAGLPAPSHSTVMSAGAVMLGGVLSVTVMVCVHVVLAVLPQSSVALAIHVRTKE